MKTTFLKISLATILCATLWSCEKVTKTDDGWVDLGLPSGLLWASCNVGADKPQDYGDYFAWGETVPRATFSEDNYNCRDIYENGNGSINELLPTDDAANANLGTPAKMPTKKDFEELVSYCEAEQIKYKGVFGIKFTAKNGNSIFMPAEEKEINQWGNLKYFSGDYWSSSYNNKNSVWYLLIDMWNHEHEKRTVLTCKEGYWAAFIRPVKPANQE